MLCGFDCQFVLHYFSLNARINNHIDLLDYGFERGGRNFIFTLLDRFAGMWNGDPIRLNPTPPTSLKTTPKHDNIPYQRLIIAVNFQLLEGEKLKFRQLYWYPQGRKNEEIIGACNALFTCPTAFDILHLACILIR